MKDKIIIYIQKEILKINKKKYSKIYVEKKILPLIYYINLSNKKKFLIGGAQGIGKTSLLILIAKVLKKYFNKEVLTINLDNYYLSKNERRKLANNKNNLLITRGVPGTHNIKKLKNDIKSFDKNNYPISLPIFDKLVDDRLKKKKIINKKCDILLLEGWCCGCNTIHKKYLYKNINYLEEKRDADLKWREFYNKKLNTEYKSLFNMFDIKIFLKAPSFKYVLNWRLKQERRNLSYSNKAKKMTINEIKYFIQHYEKITKWMLKNNNNSSDVVLKINKNQIIQSISIN